ncbi:hypothetical protein M407DRAFT_9937 [Tulasnella calospora MUT 4182]|uniref:F-box domain-containing protein n=1 Tax=Tulasnella calospora MUT 4182 TaxID=1051891 RepID=A0A0C3Q226_9AGAM|nr:hypothetical protein M407DRAFT_9937 [Tulasnella calospora MUT 4182]
MATVFTALPPNVLLSVFQLLNPRDLVRFFSTCRVLYELSSTDPQIWEEPVTRQISLWGIPIQNAEVIGRPIQGLQRTAERPWRFHDMFKHCHSAEDFKFFRLEFEDFTNFGAVELLPTACWMFFLATQTSDDPNVQPGPKRIIAGDFGGESARFPSTVIVPDSTRTFKAQFGGNGVLLFAMAELPEEFSALFVLDFTTSPTEPNDFAILGGVTVPFLMKQDYVVVGDLWAACSSDGTVVLVWDWRAGTQVFCRLEPREEQTTPSYMPLVDVRGGIVFFWGSAEQCIVGYMPSRTAEPEEPELYHLRRKQELCFSMHPMLTSFLPPPGTQCVVRVVYSTLKASEGSTHIIFAVFPELTLRIQPLPFANQGGRPKFFYMRTYPMKNHLIIEDTEWNADEESPTVCRETIDGGVIAMNAKGEILYSERAQEEGTPFLQNVLEGTLPRY